MYKLLLKNFANKPAIVLKDQTDIFNIKILYTKEQVDFEIDKIEKEVQNREETLKDLKILKSELRE